MANEGWVSWLNTMEQFFNKTTACLTEDDAGFAPTPGAFTTAQQIAHTAQCVEWFVRGGLKEEGFRTDFEAMEAEARGCATLADARAWMKRAFDFARQTVGELSEESMWETLPAEVEMFGGQPRYHILSAMADHTAHHRGALTVYARLCGKTPEMPYA